MEYNNKDNFKQPPAPGSPGNVQGTDKVNAWGSTGAVSYSHFSVCTTSVTLALTSIEIHVLKELQNVYKSANIK